MRKNSSQSRRLVGLGLHKAIPADEKVVLVIHDSLEVSRAPIEDVHEPLPQMVGRAHPAGRTMFRVRMNLHAVVHEIREYLIFPVTSPVRKVSGPIQTVFCEKTRRKRQRSISDRMYKYKRN
jgi:hypothetical protein